MTWVYSGEELVYYIVFRTLNILCELTRETLFLSEKQVGGNYILYHLTYMIN